MCNFPLQWSSVPRTLCWCASRSWWHFQCCWFNKVSSLDCSAWTALHWASLLVKYVYWMINIAVYWYSFSISVIMHTIYLVVRCVMKLMKSHKVTSSQMTSSVMVDHHHSKFVLYFQDIKDYVILNDTYNFFLALLQLAWKHTNMQYGDPLSITKYSHYWRPCTSIHRHALKRMLVQHNVKASRAKMVQRSKETATVYSVGDHVTVAVPRRLRLCLDPRRGFDRVVEVCHNRYRVRWALLTPETACVHVYKVSAPYLWSDRHIPDRWNWMDRYICFCKLLARSIYRDTIGKNGVRIRKDCHFLYAVRFIYICFRTTNGVLKRLAALCWQYWCVTGRLADSIHCRPLWPPSCAVHV
jgi:hypothetical protein